MWLRERPIYPIELSIESLEAQLANHVTSPHLACTKSIVQSILRSLSPHQSYKKKAVALAKQAIHVAVKISAWIQTSPDAIPPLVKCCLAQFEGALRDLHHFIQIQSSTFYRLLCRKAISAGYVIFEQRLSAILVHFEQCTMNLSVNDGDKIRNVEMFSNSNGLIVTGGNYYNGQIIIQQPSHQESTGIVQGLRVIPFEDISITHEIHINRGYRLHSDNTSGKARVVKVFHGPLAKERCVVAAKFHKKVLHPSFLHIIGVSPISSEVPFLVFNGEFAGSLEAGIAAALKKNLRDSLGLGIQTVIGLSSGLDYLRRDTNYPFVFAGLQDFGVFLNLEGKVIISFDPYIDRTNTDENDHEEQGTSSKVDKPLVIFHGLCKRTFDAACQVHYDGQHIERTYDDILENEDRFEDADDKSSLDNGDSSNSSRDTSPPVLHSGTSSAHRKSPPSNGHRRELVWKSESKQVFSLEDIFQEFKTSLDGLPTSSVPELQHRRGRYTAKTAHRCPGYNRTEITLTPNITGSAIVSHSTPLPHEICPVCKQVVKDAEIFDCICGGEDDESVPTIQCSRCHKWHHQPCVADVKFTGQRFMCPDCGPLVLEDYHHLSKASQSQVSSSPPSLRKKSSFSMNDHHYPSHKYGPLHDLKRFLNNHIPHTPHPPHSSTSQESELASAPQRATQSNGMLSSSPPTLVGEKNPNDGDEDDEDLEYSPTKLHVPQELYEYEGSTHTLPLSRSLSLESVFEHKELSTVIDNEDEILDEARSASNTKRGRRKRTTRTGKRAGVESPATDDTLATLAAASQSLAREISMAASKSNHHLSDRSLVHKDEDLAYFPTKLYTPGSPSKGPPTTRKSGPFVRWINSQLGSVAPYSLMSAFIGKAGKKLFAQHLEKYAPEDPLYEFYINDRGKRKRRKRELPPGLSTRDAAILSSVKKRAHYLDKGFSLCGLRFGWTFFIGLVPIVGDLTNAYLNYILVVRKARKADLPGWLVGRMLVNNAVSAGVGFIPIVGDVILAMYKANWRNAALLEEFLRIRSDAFLKMREAEREISGKVTKGDLSVADIEQIKPGSGMTPSERGSRAAPTDA